VRIAIENAYVVTVAGQEHDGGHLLVEDGRIASVGRGPAPAGDVDERIDGTGCLATPGLVNTHHHLYQWASQGLAKDSTLFEWLVTLYEPWSKMDAEVVHGAASAGLGWLAKSGCTTSTDHHYIFPTGRGACSPPRSRPPRSCTSASTRAGARWTRGGRGAGCPRTRWSRTWR
jgi:cytosine/adenosine deaminase-related metal-dependent hydrolase